MSCFSSTEIRSLAYGLFRQWWVSNHVSLNEQLATIREYLYYKRDCAMWDTEPDYFETWLFDNGYHGIIYPCYLEFLGSEYRNEEFIVELLEKSGNKNNGWETNQLIGAYLDDIEEIEE